jgi:hypothetical protein
MSGDKSFKRSDGPVSRKVQNDEKLYIDFDLSSISKLPKKIS